MDVPTATYRLQFSAAFRFSDARAIIPYLAALGISHIYASPVFRARPGSTHGYDVLDHCELNPEIGTGEEFRSLLDEIARHRMHWLQDIVPNHMAYDTANVMLADLLENGTASLYCDYFDVEWNHPYEGIRGKILAPFLGMLYGDALEAGELTLHYDAGGFALQHGTARYPVRPESYATILHHRLPVLREELGQTHADVVKLLGLLYVLRSIPAGVAGGDRRAQVTFVKRLLWEMYAQSDTIRRYIDATVVEMNGRKGEPQSFDLLHSLHQEQLYKLAFWKVATAEINYRRFFTINDLIALRMERERVFLDVHRRVLALVADGAFAGLRIDHIDGLYDPLQYLRRLRSRAPECYIVVEKILDPDEDLPADWPVQGTTGYEFLNRVNGVFCRRQNEQRFTTLYRRFTGFRVPYRRLVADEKRKIIGLHMAGDIDHLAHLLRGASVRDRHGADITLHGLRRALVEVLAWFPVYRTYINPDHITDADRAAITEAIRRARESHPASMHEIRFIERFLLMEGEERLSEEERATWVHFIMRFQQFTGPLMAKGMEDTTLYMYNRLLSLNGVGGKPDRFGTSDVEFHFANRKKMAAWPLSMNATATHDTKRGEDARTRINVLSEIPAEWERKIRLWSRWNARLRTKTEAGPAPDANDEYFYYQTLLGSLPGALTEEYLERLIAYMLKAVREAGVHTGWLAPNPAYEDALTAFIRGSLHEAGGNPFPADLLSFHRTVAFYGSLNALAQVLLKIACPGVPDFYQGTEFWDLSFVDPDNRRPVDYEARRRLLEELQSPGIPAAVTADPMHPRTKQFVIFRGLAARTRHRDIFEAGEYLPLTFRGTYRDHALGFVRRRGDRCALVVVPRFLTGVCKPFTLPCGEGVWGDTVADLPGGVSGNVIDAWSGARRALSGPLLLGELFGAFPLAMLVPEEAG